MFRVWDLGFVGVRLRSLLKSTGATRLSSRLGTWGPGLKGLGFWVWAIFRVRGFGL